MNRIPSALHTGAKVGLCIGLLSLATVLTPKPFGDATAKAALPPFNPVRPAPANSLIADCFRQARAAEQSTLDWQHRVSSLLAIGRAQLVAGDAAGARATARDALRQIPADAGNPEDVGSNIGRTDGLPLKGVVAEAIELMAQSGDPAGALRASDRLRDGEDRAETLLTVADVYAASHDLSSAKVALNEALKSGFPIHDDSDRGETLSRIAAAWQRIAPREIPPSLIPDAVAALRDATNAWEGIRTPVKLVNRRWDPFGKISLPFRVVRSYVRMGLTDEANRVAQAFEAHGFNSAPTLTQEIHFASPLLEDSNSTLGYPDLVPMLNWPRHFHMGKIVPDAKNVRSNYTDLLLASQKSDIWDVSTSIMWIAERPWASLSDPEQRLIRQVRSDLVARAGRIADSTDRAFLLCTAARLDLVLGDREDARTLVGQASELCNASVTSATTTANIGHPWLSNYTDQDSRDMRDQAVHCTLLLRVTDILCALGDFSGAARLADEKGEYCRCLCLQTIAYHAADAKAGHRALIISLEIETSFDAITANQTLSSVTNNLIRQHDWDDAHQAALSIKDPSARVHALCLLIDGYCGRESAY